MSCGNGRSGPGEELPFVHREIERLGKPTEGVRIWALSFPALKGADGIRRQPGTFRQGLLREAGALAKAPQPFAEGSLFSRHRLTSFAPTNTSPDRRQGPGYGCPRTIPSYQVVVCCCVPRRGEACGGCVCFADDFPGKLEDGSIVNVMPDPDRKGTAT